MKLNRKGIVVGALAVGALAVGAVAGGAGGVLAATGRTDPTPTATTSTYPSPPFGMGVGHFGPMCSGPGFVQGSPFAAAASYLGMSQADLQTQLQGGKTLAQVASAQGKSVSGLESAMTAAIQSNLNANTSLTADQRAAILAQVKSHLDTMVNTAHPTRTGIGPQMGMRMWS